jgi:hypothetical protein
LRACVAATFELPLLLIASFPSADQFYLFFLITTCDRDFSLIISLTLQGLSFRLPVQQGSYSITAGTRYAMTATFSNLSFEG